MDWRILFLFLAILAIGAAGYTLISSDTGDYTKVLVITLHIAKGGVSSVSEEIRYGHPPAIGLINGAFRGTLSDAKGDTVRDFGVHDPRLQFGDMIFTNGEGEDILRGITVISNEADLSLILPYTGREEKFTLTDAATGSNLADVDLSRAIAKFRDTYPEDPGTSSPAEKPGTGITIPIALGGAVLVILLFALIVMMTRRK